MAFPSLRAHTHVPLCTQLPLSVPGVDSIFLSLLQRHVYWITVVPQAENAAPDPQALLLASRFCRAVQESGMSAAPMCHEHVAVCCAGCHAICVITRRSLSNDYGRVLAALFRHWKRQCSRLLPQLKLAAASIDQSVLRSAFQAYQAIWEEHFGGATAKNRGCKCLVLPATTTRNTPLAGTISRSSQTGTPMAQSLQPQALDSNRLLEVDREQLDGVNLNKGPMRWFRALHTFSSSDFLVVADRLTDLLSESPPIVGAADWFSFGCDFLSLIFHNECLGFACRTCICVRTIQWVPWNDDTNNAADVLRKILCHPCRRPTLFPSDEIIGQSWTEQFQDLVWNKWRRMPPAALRDFKLGRALNQRPDVDPSTDAREASAPLPELHVDIFAPMSFREISRYKDPLPLKRKPAMASKSSPRRRTQKNKYRASFLQRFVLTHRPLYLSLPSDVQKKAILERMVRLVPSSMHEFSSDQHLGDYLRNRFERGYPDLLCFGQKSDTNSRVFDEEWTLYRGMIHGKVLTTRREIRNATTLWDIQGLRSARKEAPDATYATHDDAHGKSKSVSQEKQTSTPATAYPLSLQGADKLCRKVTEQNGIKKPRLPTMLPLRGSTDLQCSNTAVYSAVLQPPLGLTIIPHVHDNRFLEVDQVLPNKAAMKCGKIHRQDFIIAINEVCVFGASVQLLQEAVSMSMASKRKVSLVFCRGPAEDISRMLPRLIRQYGLASWSTTSDRSSFSTDTGKHSTSSASRNSASASTPLNIGGLSLPRSQHNRRDSGASLHESVAQPQRNRAVPVPPSTSRKAPIVKNMERRDAQKKSNGPSMLEAHSRGPSNSSTACSTGPRNSAQPTRGPRLGEKTARYEVCLPIPCGLGFNHGVHGRIVVTHLQNMSPAANSNYCRVGDILVSIDGQSLAGAHLSNVAPYFEKKKGKEIVFEFERSVSSAEGKNKPNEHAARVGGTNGDDQNIRAVHTRVRASQDDVIDLSDIPDEDLPG